MHAGDRVVLQSPPLVNRRRLRLRTEDPEALPGTQRSSWSTAPIAYAPSCNELLLLPSTNGARHTSDYKFVKKPAAVSPVRAYGEAPGEAHAAWFSGCGV
jgi:hypothetical protein